MYNNIASYTKKKKKKSDHVSKESKKDAKEITEKKKPEKKKLPEAIRKKIRTELKDEKLPAGKYTSIYKAVEESENKLALNNALVKTFDTTIGSKIYNHIKKIYTPGDIVGIPDRPTNQFPS